jgi:hypothetical protein
VVDLLVDFAQVANLQLEDWEEDAAHYVDEGTAGSWAGVGPCVVYA